MATLADVNTSTTALTLHPGHTLHDDLTGALHRQHSLIKLGSKPGSGDSAPAAAGGEEAAAASGEPARVRRSDHRTGNREMMARRRKCASASLSSTHQLQAAYSPPCSRGSEARKIAPVLGISSRGLRRRGPRH